MIAFPRKLLCHCGAPLSIMKLGDNRYGLGHLESVDCMALTGDAEDVLSEFLNNGLSAPTEEEIRQSREQRRNLRSTAKQSSEATA